MNDNGKETCDFQFEVCGSFDKQPGTSIRLAMACDEAWAMRFLILDGIGWWVDMHAPLPPSPPWCVAANLKVWRFRTYLHTASGRKAAKELRCVCARLDAQDWVKPGLLILEHKPAVSGAALAKLVSTLLTVVALWMKDE